MPTKRPGSPYEDGRIRLEEYDVLGHDGKTHLRTVVRHPNAVALLALIAPDELLMVRNFRLPVDAPLLEVPAGCLEPGETAEEAARRELEEETGYCPGKLQKVRSFFPSPGLLDERIDLFVATELTLGTRQLDATEMMEVERWKVDALLHALDSGEIQDAKTSIALFHYARHMHDRRS